MGFTWRQTRFKGLRYREHASRRHGVRLDRCYQVRFLLDGQRVEETLGWQSEGWTEEKAALKLGELREAHRTGQGERTLAEKRAKAQAKRKAEEAAKAAKLQEALTFGEVFESHYWPHAQGYKTARVLKTERSMWEVWMKGTFADKPMVKVVPLDIERVRKALRDAGRSDRTQHLAVQVVRQVFNFAIGSGLFFGTNPAQDWQKQAKLKGQAKRKDDRRIRFLTRDEADMLLSELAKISMDTHDAALISLQTGMRWGEIAALTWQDVDFDSGIITLRNTKNGRTRSAYITKDVHEMLQRRAAEKDGELVFPSQNGKQGIRVSNTFGKIVDALGLNDGIEDNRQRVVFHTCRHTFASWLVQQGTSLYDVKELMGHQSIAMTERYSHLAPEGLRSAVKQLEKGLESRKSKVVNLHRN